MEVFINPAKTRDYPTESKAVLSAEHLSEPKAMLAACPAYRETRLWNLSDLARDLGLGAILFKDESQRLGLGSFKALGGVYAVARLVKERAEAALGRSLAPEELISDEVKALSADVTVACTSAGNHGMAVAAGARIFGCRCVVYLAATVPTDFDARLQEKGAEVVREGAVYEESMALVRDACEKNGWHLVSDAAWPGYEAIPTTIMRGYLVMAEEAAEQCAASGGLPTHLFLQAGVGGLAGAMAAYFHDRFGADAPRMVVVEPTGAPCLTESAKAGKMVAVEGKPTVLGRLDCREASSVAYPILAASADAFVTIEDEEAFEAMRRLNEAGLKIGESGAAGLGAVITACADPVMREELALGPDSRVLLIGSEGPADRALFEEVVGDSAD